MFRIPRVTAELKCSLETDHEKKFNVILYSDRTDVRDFHQQTVQLEVVAVPVPPDYLNYLVAHPAAPSAASGNAPLSFAVPGANSQPTAPPASTQTPGPVVFSGPEDEGLPPAKTASSDSGPAAPAPGEATAWLHSYLVDEPAREEVRALIEKLDTKQCGKRRSAVRKLLLPAWAKALVLTDGHNARFILLAVKTRRPHLVLWQLVLRPAALQRLYKLPAQSPTGPELSRIQSLVAQLGELQAAAGRRR